MYYRNAQAALVAYDLTKSSSLVKARHWVAELQRQASPGIVIALVGNKLDLVEGDGDEGESSAGQDGSAESREGGADQQEGAKEDEEGKTRKVTTEEAKAFAEEEGLLFFESSAKTGANVAEVFAAIAGAIPETALKGRGAGAGAQGGMGGGQQGGSAGGRDPGRVDLGRSAGEAKGDGCAC